MGRNGGFLSLRGKTVRKELFEFSESGVTLVERVFVLPIHGGTFVNEMQLARRMD